jgi:hypothetical protein
MISAFLGLQPDGAAATLVVRAFLPDWLTSIRVSRLGIGKETVTITAQRQSSGETEVRVEPLAARWNVEAHPARSLS